MIDTLVVGGGPAGLAAAIGLAAAGRAVTVIEPHPGIIDKACGEGLMPGALDHLAALGVPEPPGVPFVGIRYQDARRPERHATGDFPHRPGRGVRRLALHAALIDRARALGVRWHHERVDALEQTDTHVTATAGARLTAGHLIAADGLHSPTRRLLGLDRPTASRRYGIRRHYALAPWTDRVEVHWTPTAEAYVTPVAAPGEDTPGEVGVAILFDKPGRFPGLIGGFPLLYERLRGAEQTSKTRGAGPFHQRARTQRLGRVLLVGDAAGYLDPLTGEGIALGLATAAEAVRCVVDDDLAAYPRRWRRATRRYYALTAGLLALARFAPTRRLLIPAAATLPGVFDLTLRLLGGGHPPAITANGHPTPTALR
ncbi:MAG: NAD(P)/FAD-dependent oxidoreductase [bacterium]